MGEAIPFINKADMAGKKKDGYGHVKPSYGYVPKAGLVLVQTVTYTIWTNNRDYVSPQFLPCL